MFRAMLRSLLCKKGGCCLWLYLKRRQPFYEVDDDDLLCDPDVNVAGMSHAVDPCFLEEVPTGNIWSLPVPYEHTPLPCHGRDVTKQRKEYSCDTFVAQVARLAAEDRSASRLLACKLLCSIYGRCTPPVKEYLGVILGRLCKDDDMFVRRIALSMLPDVAKEADPKFYASCVVTVLEKFLDDKIGLRLEAAKVLIALFKSQHLSECILQRLLPVLLKYAEDPDWHVRYLIANCICDMLKSVNSLSVHSSLLGLLKNLTNDAEPRIRVVTQRQVASRACTLLASIRDDCLNIIDASAA